MRLALLQDRALPLDTAANLARIDEAAGEAARGHADLLVTPELFAVGYSPRQLGDAITPEEVASARRALLEIARRNGVALVFSLPGTGAPGSRTITATLVDEAGTVLLDYAKLHLFGDDERASFVGGDRLPDIIPFHGVPTSLVVCYDIEFPEPARAAAAAGARLLLVPTALSVGFDEVNRVLVPARALENDLVVAYANHLGEEAGVEFSGQSTIADGRGRILLDAGDLAGVRFVDVPLESGGAAPSDVAGPDYLRDLRTDLFPPAPKEPQ